MIDVTAVKVTEKITVFQDISIVLKYKILEKKKHLIL